MDQARRSAFYVSNGSIPPAETLNGALKANPVDVAESGFQAQAGLALEP